MNTAPLYVYPKDLLRISNITHPNSVYHKYKEIKESLGKLAHQYITVKEMANWLGIAENDIIERIT
jgi:hypothetical protein